jgi:hypothetical protein
VLEHYMLQSEQLDTTLILAADGKVAAGLLIQRLPVEGPGQPRGLDDRDANEDEIGANETTTASPCWPHAQARGAAGRWMPTPSCGACSGRSRSRGSRRRTPSFACSCSRDRVGSMMRSLGTDEAESIISERGKVEVGCEFCGAQYDFDRWMRRSCSPARRPAARDVVGPVSQRAETARSAANRRCSHSGSLQRSQAQAQRRSRSGTGGRASSSSSTGARRCRSCPQPVP